MPIEQYIEQAKAGSKDAQRKLAEIMAASRAGLEGFRDDAMQIGQQVKDRGGAFAGDFVNAIQSGRGAPFRGAPPGSPNAELAAMVNMFGGNMQGPEAKFYPEDVLTNAAADAHGLVGDIAQGGMDMLRSGETAVAEMLGRPPRQAMADAWDATTAGASKLAGVLSGAGSAVLDAAPGIASGALDATAAGASKLADMLSGAGRGAMDHGRFIGCGHDGHGTCWHGRRYVAGARACGSHVRGRRPGLGAMQRGGAAALGAGGRGLDAALDMGRAGVTAATPHAKDLAEILARAGGAAVDAAPGLAAGAWDAIKSGTGATADAIGGLIGGKPDIDDSINAFLQQAPAQAEFDALMKRAQAGDQAAIIQLRAMLQQ